MGVKVIALGACLIVAAPALAQQVATPTAVPVAAVLDQAPSNILRVGTKVPLKMSEQLTTKGKKLRVGQRFQLEVAENVLLADQVIIPVGTPATGEVTDVRNKGMWGKSGHISAQLLYLRINGRQIRLSGSFDDKGVTGTAGVVASIALVPLAGFFVTGTSAEIKVGGAVTGFLDEDVTVAFAAPAAPAPLVVPATAPKAE